MEIGESRDTAISNQEVGFTSAPTTACCYVLGWESAQHVQKKGTLAMQKQNVH